MEQRELESTLGAHQFDTSSLSLILSRGDEHLYELIVPEGEAIPQWRRLREALTPIGYWPVVGYGAQWLNDEVPEYRDKLLSGSTSDILAEAEAIDPEAWMRVQEQDWLDTMREGAEEFGESEPLDADEDITGEWPEHAEPYTTFAIPHDTATSELVPRVPIGLVPVTASWQVPAVLRFEVWGAPPAVHVAMARRWHNLYGAEIIGVLPDLLEMHVSRPPSTREAALVLAKEHFLYCGDVVIQGTQTLQALAAGLLNGTAWYFWWD